MTLSVTDIATRIAELGAMPFFTGVSPAELGAIAVQSLSAGAVIEGDVSIDTTVLAKETTLQALRDRLPSTLSGDRLKTDGSVTSAFAITPADGADLSTSTRGLFVGTGGNLAVIHTGNGTSVVYKNIASGATLPFAVKRVLITGTTCADIVGLV